jgi:hypothetical protein
VQCMASIYTLKILAHDTPTYQSPSSANFFSCLRSNNLSTQPPGGKFLSHRLCRCTANTLLSLRSSPPPSARVKPPVQCLLLGSGSNGSGRRLSRRHAWPSEKQKGRILNGGIPSATRRRQRRRYRIEPQSEEDGRGGVEVVIRWNASQR